MQAGDLDAVRELLEQYIQRFDINPAFSIDELRHWLFFEAGQAKEGGKRVVWAYVVEDLETQKITDFVSFYSIESAILSHSQSDVIRTAYLYYYATDRTQNLQQRLQGLINDALILAKKVRLGFLQLSSILPFLLLELTAM